MRGNKNIRSVIASNAKQSSYNKGVSISIHIVIDKRQRIIYTKIVRSTTPDKFLNHKNKVKPFLTLFYS